MDIHINNYFNFNSYTSFNLFCPYDSTIKILNNKAGQAVCMV